jgi:hypothetical protein
MTMTNPMMSPEHQEIYIKAYPKIKWLNQDGKFVPDGIEGYIPIQVTNSLAIEINKLISYEAAKVLVTDPKIAFSVVAKPGYIK